MLELLILEKRKMKKNILSILFIFAVISLSAAKVKKLALLGESRTVDILTAKLSDRKDFELFERGQIEQILREHQLSSYALSPDIIVKYFSHVNLIVIISQAGKKKATYPSRITIFNAQNGYKLANTALPKASVEAAEKAVEIIDIANGKATKASLLLSIGIIRNAGVSDKLKYRIAEIVFSLSEALVNSDKIQMLERGYLGAVLNERKLSGTTHTLKTSNRMINLEFLPGNNLGQIDVVLRLCDPDGKVFFSKKYPAVQKTNKMIREICEILKTTPAKTISKNKEEAKRYFDEYKAFFKIHRGSCNRVPRYFEDMEPLLFAMIALAPQNPRYRYEKIFYDLCRIHGRYDSKRKLNILYQFVKSANAFIDEYPDFKYPRYSGGFKRSSIHSTSPWGNIVEYFPMEKQAELAGLIAQMKKIAMRTKNGQSNYFHIDPETIKNPRDLYNYRETVRCQLQLCPENDALRMVRESYEADVKIITVTEAFAKKYPKLAVKAKKHYYDVFFPSSHHSWPRYRRKEALKELKKILNEKFDTLRKLYISTGKQRIIDNLNKLEGVHDYLNSDGSKGAYKQALEDVLKRAKLKKIHPGTFYFPLMSDIAEMRGLSRSWVINYNSKRPLQYLQEKKKSREVTTPQKAVLLVQAYMNGLEPAKSIIDNIDIVRKIAYMGICNNGVVRMMGRLTGYLYRNMGNKTQRRKILEMLNNNFSIEIFKLPFKYTLDVIVHREKVYLLQATKRRKLRLCEYDSKSGKISQLNIAEIALNNFQRYQKNFGQLNSSTISISDNHIFIGGENNMLVYDLTSKKSTLLKDLPGKYIATVTTYKDRIYYLCGTKNGFPNSPSLFSMHSCKFDGSDRKTLFSSQRLNKEHELDRITSAVVSTFVVLPNGKSLFAVSKMNCFGKIYCFNPKDESFVLISDPKKEHIVNLFDHGNFILGQEGRNFGESYFLMDKRKLQREYFFTQNKRDKRRPYKYRIPGYHSVRDAVRLFEKRYLVYGSEANGCGFLDLHDLEHSPMLLLDGVNNMIYMDIVEKFIFTTRSKSLLYVVKLKREAGK